MTNQTHTIKSLGCYEVHSNGLIYSNSGWRGKTRSLLTVRPDKHGYFIVRITINNKRTDWKIHKLIAELFLEPRPSTKHEIRHLDGDKRNNNIENLAWGTRQENANDREKHGRTSRGVNHSNYIKNGFKNSKYIKHCVNCHYELVNTLKDVKRYLESVEHLLPETQDREEVTSNLINIINKAEGN